MSNIFYGRSIDMKFVPDNTRSWLDYLIGVDKKKLVVTIERETGKRTPDQNKALHKYFQTMSDKLNDAGFPFKYFMGDKVVEIDWTPRLFKEVVWKPIQKAITGKEHTADLDKVSEITIVYEHLNRFFSNKPFCIHVPFPNNPNKHELAKIDYPTQDESNTPTI